VGRGKLGPLPPLEKEKKPEPIVEKKPEPIIEEKKIEKPAPVIKQEIQKEEIKKEPVKTEDKKSVTSEDSSEKEKQNLREVDEKLEKLTAGIKIDKKPAIAQNESNKNKNVKENPTDDYDKEHFEYDFNGILFLNREIEEDIIGGDSDHENVLEQPKKDQRMFTDSGGFTASASLGIDPSVDSLALEEYDYIEPVEKASFK